MVGIRGKLIRRGLALVALSLCLLPLTECKNSMLDTVKAVNKHYEATLIPPTAPEGLTLTSADFQLAASWTAVLGAKSYEVYWNTANDSSAIPQANVKTAASASCTITGLTNGTPYYLWVKAKNDSGESGFSAAGTGTPLAAATAPAQPGAPAVTVGDGQLSLSWSSVSGATSYDVYWFKANDPGLVPASNVQNSAEASATITGLTNGTTYYVWLKANNGVGSSSFSVSASGVPVGTATIATAAAVGGPAGSGQLAVTWTAATGATAYDLYYSATGTPPGSANGPTNQSGTTATISGLINYTTYNVWVAAKNSGGTSALSTMASGTPGIHVTGVSLNKNTETTMYTGQSDTLAATFNAGATNTSLTWKSDATSVATVESGVVTIVKSGTATITATSVDAPSKSASCRYTVPAVSISLNPTSLSLVSSGATGTTTATVSNAVDTSVNWSTSDSSVATVDGGIVTPVGVGPATITAKSNADTSEAATCAVTIVAAPISLLAIPGVVVPVRGAIPDTTAIDTAQYTGTITWAPGDNPFTAVTVYTATIVLTAKPNWSLTGVAANSFTVAGASATTNAVNSGTVAAVFPATFAAPILTMITVPAGSFQRDATATNISTITASFKMSEKEITMEQFISVTGLANPSTSFTGVVNGPVQMINWYHALVFCNKLSIAEGLTPVYTIRSSTVPDAWDGTMDGVINVPTGRDATWDAAIANWGASGYRLPTEMEWMWAAMGATSDRSNGYTGIGINTTGYTKGYAGNTEIGGALINVGNYAWYSANSGSTTHLVGSAGTTGHPNELGLYDMSGNVWEWCWDWYAAYDAGTLVDSRGAASSWARVIRGGCWGDSSSSLACASRYGINGDPYYQSYDIGFRVVRP
jgi:formylglycine-generating enzyme required for sulfatase activity/uncharacterized protein YjdB